MPSRFPPAEPTPPARGATPSQQQRYRKALHAWMVGEALREYAASKRVTKRHIADEISIMPSPQFDGIGGGRRYAEDGTPRTMEDVCAWIDRQAKTVATVGEAYLRLSHEHTLAARAAWLRHVGLYSLQEVADDMGVSTRTVIRALSVANLTLMAALSGGASDGKTARGLRRDAERLSTKPTAPEVDADELALAGVEPRPIKGTPERKYPR